MGSILLRGHLLQLLTVSDQRYLDHLQAAGSEFECFRQIPFWSQKWRIMPWGNTPTSMKTSISAQSFVKYAVVDELISTELSFKGVYFQICREISELCISMFTWVNNSWSKSYTYESYQSITYSGTRETGSFPPRRDLYSQGQTSKDKDRQAKIVTSSATALTQSEWADKNKQTNALTARMLYPASNYRGHTMQVRYSILKIN